MARKPASPRSRLDASIRRGRLRSVAAILDGHPAALHERNAEGLLPVHVAALHGRGGVFKHLLGLGADPVAPAGGDGPHAGKDAFELLSEWADGGGPVFSRDDRMIRFVCGYGCMGASAVRVATRGAAADLLPRGGPFPHRLPTGHAPNPEVELRADILLEVADPDSGDTAFLIGIEHQSSADPAMVGRGLRYLAEMAHDWMERNPGAASVPPVSGHVLCTTETVPGSLPEVPPFRADGPMAGQPALAFRMGVFHPAMEPGPGGLEAMEREPMYLLLRILHLNRLARGLEAGSERWRELVLEVTALVRKLDRAIDIDAAPGRSYMDLKRVVLFGLLPEHFPGSGTGRLIREGLDMTDVFELVGSYREREGLQKGRLEGRLEGELATMAGEREMIIRMAGERFGDMIAGPLREWLAGITDPSRLHEAGPLIMRQRDSGQILALIRGAAPAGSANGHDPEQP